MSVWIHCRVLGSFTCQHNHKRTHCKYLTKFYVQHSQFCKSLQKKRCYGVKKNEHWHAKCMNNKCCDQIWNKTLKGYVSKYISVYENWVVETLLKRGQQVRRKDKMKQTSIIPENSKLRTHSDFNHIMSNNRRS